MQRAFALHTKADAMFGNATTSPSVKAATHDTQKQMTKLLQDMKQEFGQTQNTKPKTPAANKSPKSVAFQPQETAPSDAHFYAMDRRTWASKFGQKTIKGKPITLCWHRCNSPQGCGKGTTCTASHQAYPEAYNNGPIAKLPIETQWSIIKACRN